MKNILTILTKLAQIVVVLGFSSLTFAGCAHTDSSEVISNQQSKQEQPQQQNIFQDRQKITLTIDDAAPIEVEVVNTPASITQGLSGREEIGADGMLFMFEKEGNHAFWMKEMKFDLDFVWIRDGKVVDLTEDVPAPEPNTPLTKLPTYSAKELVDSVLELEAGKITELDIEVGDEVTF